MRLTPRRRTDRSTSSRPGRDDGASVVIVAMLLGTGVMIGMSALTVDVGLAYAERRELQNGADAAALAVAGGCTSTPTACAATAPGLAGSYADLNARDGASAVSVVCGEGSGLPACPAGTGSTLSTCSATSPTGTGGWVEVRTATETTAGEGLLPPVFSSALTGQDEGIGVRACARASFGPPASIVATSIAISRCDWDSMTANGSDFAPPPPYPGGSYPSTYERWLQPLDTSGAGTCSGSGGTGSDLPGGFGWLRGSGCTTTVTATGTAQVRSAGQSACARRFTRLARSGGGLIYVPVFGAADTRLTFDGFAAFYLTGWDPDEQSISGWFTRDFLPAANFVPSTGPSGTPRGLDSLPRLVG